MKEFKFKGRHSIDNILKYKIESYYIWICDTNNDKMYQGKIYQGKMSGKWKSGTRFKEIDFVMKENEWAYLKSLHRDEKINQILS